MTEKNEDTSEQAESQVEESSAAPSPEDGEDTVAGSEAVREAPEAAEPIVPRLKVAFPLIVVALQLGLAYYFFKTSTTPMRTYMGIGAAPVAATVLLLGWWLLSLSIPLRDRLLGVLFAAAAVAIPLLTIRPMDAFFLVYLLPSVTTAVVLMAAATRGMAWKRQRKGMMAALTLCLVFFCFTRVTGVDGNMAPLLGWRWSGEANIAVKENKVATVAKAATPKDWPGFRGPKREGRNDVDRFGIDWQTNPPKELWRRPVGPGWSSFAVIGAYCFTQEQRGDQEAVVCYDANTGEQVWVNLADARFEDVMGNGPRTTPTFHKGKLYAIGATGIFRCIDGATGETLWERNIAEDGASKMPKWGFSSSPLIAGNLVVAFAGGGKGKSLVAYNQETGEIVWTAGEGKGGYSSPQLEELALTPQIIQLTNDGIEAVDPKTGTALWNQEWKLKNSPRCVQPFVLDLYQVIAGTGQGKGARLIKVDTDVEAGTWTVESKWTSKKFRPYFNDYVYYNGYCYGFDGDRLACMDTIYGELRWTGDKVGGQIMLLHAMEMLLVLTESGEVLLIPAFPEDGNIVARMQALNGKTWNHPVVSGGRLYVRNDTEAACYELPPAPVEETAAEEESKAAH